MFKHILFPTDGSDLAAKGVKEMIEMAKAFGAHVTAVYVMRRYRTQEAEGYLMPEVSFLRTRFEDDHAARAGEILDPIREAANDAGVECDTVISRGDSPHVAIIEQAKASKCDLIVMASHARKGIQRLLYGSETQKVLTHSNVPVLVVR